MHHYTSHCISQKLQVARHVFSLCLPLTIYKYSRFVPSTHFYFLLEPLMKMHFCFPITSFLRPNNVTCIWAFSVSLPLSHSLCDCESVCETAGDCVWWCVPESVVNNLKTSSGLGKAMWVTMSLGEQYIISNNIQRDSIKIDNINKYEFTSWGLILCTVLNSISVILVHLIQTEKKIQTHLLVLV